MITFKNCGQEQFLILPGGFSVHRLQLGPQVQVTILQRGEVYQGAEQDPILGAFSRTFPNTVTDEEIFLWCEDVLRGERDHQVALMDQADERAVRTQEAISALEDR